MIKKIILTLMFVLSSSLYAMSPPSSSTIIEFIVDEDIIICPIYSVSLGRVNYNGYALYSENGGTTWNSLDQNSMQLLEDFINNLEYDLSFGSVKLDIPDKTVESNGKMYRITDRKIQVSTDNGTTWNDDWVMSDSRYDFLERYNHTINWGVLFIGPFDIITVPNQPETVLVSLGSEGVLIKNKDSEWLHVAISEDIKPSPEKLIYPFRIFAIFSSEYIINIFLLFSLFIIFVCLNIKIISKRNKVKIKIFTSMFFTVLIVLIFCFLAAMSLYIIWFFTEDSIVPIIIYSIVVFLYIRLRVNKLITRNLSLEDRDPIVKNLNKLNLSTVIAMILPLLPYYLWGTRVILQIRMVNYILTGTLFLYSVFNVLLLVLNPANDSDYSQIHN